MQTTPEAIRNISSKAVASYSGQFVGAIWVVWGLYYSLAPLPVIIGWPILLFILLFARNMLLIDIKKSLNSIPQKDITSKLHYFHLNIFMSGSLWGLGMLYFIQIAPFGFVFLSLAIAATLIGAAILTLGASFLAYALFTFPLILSMMLSYLMLDSELWLIASFGTLFGTIYLALTAYIYSQNFQKTIDDKKRIENTKMDLIQSLGRASEYRDEETGNHIMRMSYGCMQVAKQLGFSEQAVKTILKASRMHDIGKIGIPDAILLKPGKLSPTERSIMEKHTTIGLSIMCDSDSETIQVARKIIIGHHEKWDGTGYPNKLKGEEIPIESRIAAVCDVFDALISDRPYKKGWDNESARQYIQDNSGGHFDPTIVKAFMVVYPKIILYNDSHK